MGLAVSVVAFLRSENSGTLPRDKRVRSPADGLSKSFQGDLAQTPYRSTKFLIRSPVPDIISIRVEANLSDRLHWCGREFRLIRMETSTSDLGICVR